MYGLRMSMILAPLVVLLAGCGFNPMGAEAPKPVTVAQYLNETTAGSVTADGTPLTAGEYLVASISFTNEKCHEFFNDLARYEQGSEIVGALLSSLVATGSPVLALSETGETVGTVSAVLGAMHGFNAKVSDIIVVKAVEDSMKDLIFREMQSVLRVHRLDVLADLTTGLKRHPSINGEIDVATAKLFFKESGPINLMIARNIATDYASKCTLANMKAAIERSVDKNNGTQEGGGSLGGTSGSTVSTPAVEDEKEIEDAAKKAG